jgi:hypothetical protein
VIVGKVDILLPCAAMVLLTAIVWVRMFVVRIAEIGEKKLDPQSIRNSVLGAGSLERVEAADNFKNLFEVPVLFYSLCACLAGWDHVTPVFVIGAWLFVALRALHSFIHLTYNQVMHRFYAYAAGTVLIFALWGVFALRLLAQRTV